MTGPQRQKGQYLDVTGRRPRPSGNRSRVPLAVLAARSGRRALCGDGDGCPKRGSPALPKRRYAAASRIADASYRVIDIEKSGASHTLRMVLKSVTVDERGQLEFASIDEESWQI